MKMMEPELSDAARQIFQTKLGGGEAYARLVVRRPPEGRDAEALYSQIAKLTPDTVLRHPVKSLLPAKAVLAGLWMWHDFLDESHSISQSLPDPTGSFWHAIMHRREGDFSNAKYWYARCRGHKVLNDLAAMLASTPSAARFVRAGSFDPDEFVDRVEENHELRDETLIAVQRLEFEALFTHCVRESLALPRG